MADISPITTARFWSKVDVPQSNSDCWTWTGALAGSGYGSFKVPEIDNRARSAHRVAYRLARGEWPEDNLLIRHKCDNPRCVNPFHLETGTHMDNSKDMLDRGRAAKRGNAGEDNPHSKLTAENVRDVRRMINSGLTNVAIGKYFGVHHATISKIRTGGSWA